MVEENFGTRVRNPARRREGQAYRNRSGLARRLLTTESGWMADQIRNAERMWDSFDINASLPSNGSSASISDKAPPEACRYHGRFGICEKGL